MWKQKTGREDEWASQGTQRWWENVGWGITVPSRERTQWPLVSCQGHGPAGTQWVRRLSPCSGDPVGFGLTPGGGLLNSGGVTYTGGGRGLLVAFSRAGAVKVWPRGQ